MQVAGHKMNTPSTVNRVDWDDKEWSLVAQELKRQHPSRAERYYDFAYTTMEVEDAAEQVLPQERHRAIDSFELIKRPLFNAFELLKPGNKPVLSVVPGPVRNDGHIVWSPEEWEVVVAEIHEIDPACFDNQCHTLNMLTVMRAQQVLAVHRRRNFKQLVSFRPQVFKTWEQMKVTKANEPPPVIVDFPSGPIMEPKPTKKHAESALATAMHEAFQASPQEEKQRKPYVSWKPEEELAIAREMRRQNPHINFFASKFHIIDLPAIRDAQREALPLERRKALKNSTGLQPFLVRAFAALLEEVNRENAGLLPNVKVSQASLEVVPEPILVSAPLPAEVVAEAPIQAPQPVQTNVAEVYAKHEPLTVSLRDAQENTFAAALLNAVTPLVNFMFAELSARLAPEIAKLMLPEIVKALGSAQQVVTAPQGAFISPPYVESGVYGSASVAPAKVPEVAPPRPTAAQIAAFNGVTQTKTKKHKIVLLGPMGKQKSDIEQAFPDYNFVFIEHGHGIKEAAVDCALFIAYTSHYNAANKASVKKFVPLEKFRQVQGSLTMVKNQIQVWEVAQGIQKG